MSAKVTPLPLLLPPHSIECEQSVIGSLLMDSAVFDKVADILVEDDFFRDDHRRIFRHIAKLIEAREVVDVVTVADSLAASKEDEQAGGLAYLGEIANNTPSTANVVGYANVVREKALLRRMIAASHETAAEAHASRAEQVDDLIERANARLLEIAESRARKQTGFVRIGQTMQEVVTRLDELSSSDVGNGVTGLSTGFADLDVKTSGFHDGDLVVVAGRPSMGKTAFALNIAEHVAEKEGGTVAVFSMEMPTTQLAMRLLASVGRINQQGLRTGRLHDDEWARVTEALGRLDVLPIFIDETPALSSTELRARVKRLERAEGRLSLVVVDYLQLMRASREGIDNRATEVGEISRSLKALAKELRCPVIALSQLNRALEQRPNKRPVMSDLRESGAIEQDADTILFIYRDEVYHPDSPDLGTAEIILGKQRNGPIGMERLAFVNALTHFENLAPGWKQPVAAAGVPHERGWRA